MLTVTLVDSAIYDAAGNPASVTQNNNSTTLIDQKASTISSVTPSPDNSKIIVTFSEAVFSKSDGTGVLDSTDFSFTISGGTATLLSTTPTSISVTNNTIHTLGISLSTKPDGNEVLTVTLVNLSLIHI